MSSDEILKQGKHTSKKILIVYAICITAIIFSLIIATERIENEKPNATDFTQNGAIGTEIGKYVYLQIDGLSDVIATYGENEIEKYYIAINGYNWYIVSLSSTDLEELKNIQAYTYGQIDNKPASVKIYGITEGVPEDLKKIAIDFYNKGLEDDEKITIDDFENYFGSVMLNTTKDFLIDTTNGTFVVVKFSDIKWIYTHRLKYYGVVSISNNIIIQLKDGKTQFQCLNTKGKISDEFENVFEKICKKVSNDTLKGYTQENIKEYKEYKRELKNGL